MMDKIAPFTSEECRMKAEARLALADRGGAARESLLVDAEAWLILADHLDFIATSLAAMASRKLH
jgi:hypothetical protein